MTTTAWACRQPVEALSPERLAALVEAEVERSERMLFTLTPGEELDAIGRSQRLADLAFAQQLRVIAAAHSRATTEQREFASDELALALGVGSGTALRLLNEALGLCSLPGMVEAVEAGWLTQHHATAVLRELDAVEGLGVEQRAAVVMILLARLQDQTPYELVKLVRRLVLLIDLPAAQAREAEATRKRHVAFWGGVNGQATVAGTGPLLQIEAIRASLRRWLAEHPKAPDDPRTESEREFDLYASLLTGGVEAGSWQAAIVVPFTVTDQATQDLELAEVPGLGPVLPSTARDVLADAEWSQIAVDDAGHVLAAGAPVATPKAERLAEKRRLISQPPPPGARVEQLGVGGYAATPRLRRFLQARDQHCVFPGCHRRITDVDHRIPWPRGSTTHDNLNLLCRHHHRAKQAVFTLEKTPEGDYLWTTRGGWQFTRHQQGYRARSGSPPRTSKA